MSTRYRRCVRSAPRSEHPRGALSVSLVATALVILLPSIGMAQDKPKESSDQSTSYQEERDSPDPTPGNRSTKVPKQPLAADTESTLRHPVPEWMEPLFLVEEDRSVCVALMGTGCQALHRASPCDPVDVGLDANRESDAHLEGGGHSCGGLGGSLWLGGLVLPLLVARRSRRSS